MSDDAARERLATATGFHRERVRTAGGVPEPQAITSLAQRAVEAVRVLPDPDSPIDPHYRKPETIAPVQARRPFPGTAGPSEWAKVEAPLQQAILSAIADNRWPIYLCGPVGTGKTCAAACLYRGWSRSAVWYECADVVSDVFECRTNKTHTITRVNDRTSYQEGEQTIFRLIAETSLLVLNDFGLRQPSDAVYEILIRIVDRRLGKPLVVTSNLDPEQLANVFDDRVASRLLRGAVIHAVGGDRRSENHRFVRVKAS